MRKIIFFLCLLIIVHFADAQKRNTKPNKEHSGFKSKQSIEITTDTTKQLEITREKKRLLSIAKDRFNFSIGNSLFGSRQNLAIRFQANTKSKVYQGNNWRWGKMSSYGTYIIDGTAAVEFADVGITRETAKDFRYHVIYKDSMEIVGWKMPTEFRNTADGKSTYAYLGNYKYVDGGYIKIEIYNTKDFQQRDAMVVDWRPVKPAKARVGVEYTMSKTSGGPFYASLDNLKASKYYNIISTDNLDEKKFFLSDSLVRLNVYLPQTNYSYNAELIREAKNKLERIDLGNYDSRFFIYKEFWKLPGKYEISLTPRLSAPGGTPIFDLKNKSISYKFTVLPPKNSSKLFSTKQLVISGLLFSLIVGAITGGLAVYVKNKQIKEKVAAEAKQKEVAQLKLNSVRSQLNPHFLFNALAGIQNLMNKNEINLANRYLSKFARLTRNVLESRELVSLNEEKTLLDDYLQMEQLRFGFQYHIQISTELDSENIEIPAMLLQPFVENSVKHGIAEKASEGKIEVSFEKNEADLILKIIDNGKGFDEGKTYCGLGLSLSKNRISLLNTIYKDTPFVLDIQSNSSGTTVTVTLTQWL